MRFFIQFAVAAICVPTLANAEPYISAFGGISLPSDRFANDVTDIDGTNGVDGFIFPEVTGFDTNGSAITISQPGFSAGTMFGGAIGYEFKLSPKTFLRIEAEGNHQSLRDNILGPELFADEAEIADALAVRFGATSTLAELNTTSGMMNIKLGRKFSSHQLSTYIGAGLGITNLSYSVHQTNTIEITGRYRLPSHQQSSGRSHKFSWQAIGGIGVEITPRLEFFVEGRYFQTSKFMVGAPTREFGEAEILPPISPLSPFTPSIGFVIAGPAPGFPATAQFSNTSALIGIRISLN